jgi:RES domain-containing protein
MEVFRICRDKYAHSLLASGAPNRWNKKDEFVIYTAGNRALSTLEMLVNKSYINISNQYKLLIILIKDESLIQELNINDLPDNWKANEVYSVLQEIGSKWYASKKSLVLKVPSVIVPKEYNFIINTHHPLFSANISLLSIDDFEWDNRLL